MALTQVRGSGISNMVISDAGIITKPLQPAFFVTPSTGQTNFGADDSAVTVVFGTEVFDHGGNFASNTFTAPVGGKYQFNVSVCLLNIDTAASNYQVYLVTSNRTYGFLLDPDGYDADVPFLDFYYVCVSRYGRSRYSNGCCLTKWWNGSDGYRSIWFENSF